MALLRRKEAMGYTTVVAAPEGASLGERYATIATAAALGERVRDQGGHALVVIDDLACMVRALHDCLPHVPGAPPGLTKGVLRNPSLQMLGRRLM